MEKVWNIVASTHWASVLQWIAATGVLGTAGKVAYDNRNAIKMFTENFIWALFNPRKIEKFRNMPEQSRHAERCPNCDTRMRVLLGKGEGKWNWWCQKCDETFWISKN